MYLKKVNIKNFRKYNGNDHTFLLTNKNLNKDSINIASRTTLIIGKNNTGKSTMIEALRKVIIDNSFNADDFNYSYLKQFIDDFETYLSKEKTVEKIKIPYMEFILTIGLDDSSNDLLNNLVEFINIEDALEDKKDVDIIIRYEIKNEALFEEKFEQIISKSNELANEKNDNREDKSRQFFLFNELLNLINESDYSVKYYSNNGREIKSKFSLKNLINIKCISANNINNKECLTKAFSTIINKEYKINLNNPNHSSKLDLTEEIYKINNSLNTKIEEGYSRRYNDILKNSRLNKYDLSMNSSLTLKTLLQNVLKYQYLDNDNKIPENQFGLGYTNLMMITANLIEYIDDYPDAENNSKINILTVEEPETFMHPQMQENLLSSLNSIINSLIKTSQKNINTQLIISTHSSHILNSKIHASNSFDNIDYISDFNQLKIINLNDDSIIKNTSNKSKKGKKEALNDFKFIKKHVTLATSELFFADAVVFVEGASEYELLKYYFQEENKSLKDYHISVFLINGAYASLYDGLIKTLGIPSVIITDIDLKGTNAKDDSKYTRITGDNLNEVKTTNNTLKYYFKGDTGNDLPTTLLKKPNTVFENLLVIYQYEKYQSADNQDAVYATSFEEAMVLTNYTEKAFIKILKSIHSRKFKTLSVNNAFEKSTYIQNSLSSEDKTAFAEKLLYEKITNEEFDFKLPVYIMDGISFLEKQLGVKDDK